MISIIFLDKVKSQRLTTSPTKDQKSRSQSPAKSRMSSAARKSVNANRMSVSPTKEDRKKAKIRAKYANDDADSIAALSDQLFRASHLKVTINHQSEIFSSDTLIFS